MNPQTKQPSKGNAIREKSILFALKCLDYCEELEAMRKYVISNQLCRAGTSIGANIAEAQHAESDKDFLHKMKIAMKEAEETKYWLTLCQAHEKYPFDESLMTDLNEILRILNKIMATMRKRVHPNS